jgi:hypothetical protein
MSAVRQQGEAQIMGTTVTSLADTGLRQFSDRWMWVRCKGKIRHATQGVAEAACRSLMRRGMDRAEEGRLNVYWCPRCLRWHVGHTRRPVQGDAGSRRRG